MSAFPLLNYVGILDDRGSVMRELNKIVRQANTAFVSGLRLTSYSGIPLLPYTTILTDTSSIADQLNNLINAINSNLINANAGGSIRTAMPLLTVAPEDGRDIVVALNNSISWLNGNFTTSANLVFYVDGIAGSNSNNGLSPATAWQTVAKVNAQTWLVPGTSVLFAGGQTFSGPLTPSNGLTAANPLVFGSYGFGDATINGGAGAGFLAQNMGGITVQDLIITGTNTLTNTAQGIQFDNNQAGNTTISGISVLRCTVSGFGLNGILVSGSNGSSGFSGVLIDSCTVHDCTGNSANGHGSAGILVMSIPGYGLLTLGRASHSSVTIQNCLAFNNPGKLDTNWTGSGIFIGETNNGLIQFCTAHDNGANITSGPGTVGIWTGDATNITIQFCEAYNHHSGNGDGDGFDLDGGCQNCMIQYCYSHGNQGAGFQLYTYDDPTILLDTGKVIRFCISQNDGANFPGGIQLGNDSTRAQAGDIYNNTVFNNLSASGCFGIGGLHASLMTGHVANNIFYSTSNSPLICKAFSDANPSSVVLVGNDYFATGTFAIRWNSTNYTTFAAWQTATGQEKIAGINKALTVNPQLAGAGTGGVTGGYNPALLPGYVAQAGAPVLGGGQNLSALYGISVGSQDFFGSAALLNGSSIGASSS